MINSAINRLMMTIYKNKSSSDAAQVPTSSTIQLYRIGASLTASFSLAPNTDSDSIAIEDPGRIKAGDTVKVLSTGSLHDPGLYVEAVIDDHTLSLANTSTTLTASGSAGDRLVVTNNPLTIYPSQAATSGTGSTSISSDATTGVAQGYLHEKRFDAVVTISGSPTKIIVDGQSIPVSSPVSWVNAADFPSLADAIAAVPTGGTLFIPAGDHTVPSGGLVVSKGMTIQGEPGTRLFSSSVATNQPVIKITPGGSELSGLRLRDLALLNASQPSGPLSGNYGIECDVPSDGSKMSFMVIERVVAINMGDDGIHLHALGTNDSFFVFVTLRDVACTLNRGRGLFASYANLLNCYGCYFNSNDLDGVRADASEVAFYACAFESNCKSNDTSRINDTFDGQAYLRTCAMARFDGCHFEEFTGSGHPVNKRAVMLENSSCTVVSGCAFFNASEDSSSSERGIYCTWGAGFQTPSPGVTACAIFPNLFTNVHTAVEIDAGSGAAQDCVVFPQRINSGTGTIKLPTALSDSGIVALGNRKSGTGGLARGAFLPPRQNTTGDPLPSLTSAEVGYILFDTTSKRLRLWDGSTWLTIPAA